MSFSFTLFHFIHISVSSIDNISCMLDIFSPTQIHDLGLITHDTLCACVNQFCQAFVCPIFDCQMCDDSSNGSLTERSLSELSSTEGSSTEVLTTAILEQSSVKGSSTAGGSSTEVESVIVESPSRPPPRIASIAKSSPNSSDNGGQAPLTAAQLTWQRNRKSWCAFQLGFFLPSLSASEVFLLSADSMTIGLSFPQVHGACRWSKSKGANPAGC